MITQIKEIFSFIGDYIDTKLQTRTGRMSLLIVSGIILGAASINSYNITSNYDALLVEKKNETKKKDSLQGALNSYIQGAESDCNERIREGALLHQQLKAVYNNKIEENENFIQEQQQVVKEKEKVLLIQKENINKLETLNTR